MSEQGIIVHAQHGRSPNLDAVKVYLHQNVAAVRSKQGSLSAQAYEQLLEASAATYLLGAGVAPEPA